MRELKYHEKKLLKKVDLYNWKIDSNLREVSIMRRYYVQNRNDLKVYNRVAGQIKKIINRLLKLDKEDEFRIKQTKILMNRLYDMGLITNKTNLFGINEKVGISAFCRRRLPYILFRNKYCESIKEGITFIEQGQIKVGTELVMNPGYIVTRSMEDHITWTNGSKIKRKIAEYSGKVDDYEENC